MNMAEIEKMRGLICARLAGLDEEDRLGETGQATR